MGAANVRRVYRDWAGLEHRPFRALAYMALVSLDKDDPPKYWDGRDSLAVALGYSMPEEPADGDESDAAVMARSARARGHNAVDKVTQALVKRGALLRLRQGNFRSHAVFALLLPAAEVTPQGSPTEGSSAQVPPQGSPTPPVPGPEVTPQGGPRSPLRGPVGHPSGVVEVTPQGGPKEYEEKEGVSEGMRGPAHGRPAPRARLKALPASSSQNIEEERRRQSSALQERIQNFGKETA